MLWIIAIELAIIIFQLWSIEGTIAIQTREMRQAGTARPEQP